MPGRRARRFLIGAVVVVLLATAAWGDAERPGLAGGARPIGAEAAPAVGEPGWVAAENRRHGTTAWRITARGARHAIEGYADRVSASAGDTVTLYVSTTARRFRVEAYRMGWYDGARARLLWRSERVRGRRQAEATLRPGINLVEARWKPSLDFRVDGSWPPGAYLLKLVAHGAQGYVPLTVTDPSSDDPLVVMAGVTTWQAYNNWGGRNLYWGPFGEPGTRSRVASFDRPYREEVNYKPASARSDPAWRTAPGEVTTNWREPPVGQPESSLLGQLYECNPTLADGVVVQPGSWLLDGTGLHAGSKLPNLIGPEYDRVTPGFPTPHGVELVLHSPLRCRFHDSFSDVTYYSAASGAGVVDTGTSSWVCQIDQVCAADRNSPKTSAAVRRITLNLLRGFAAGPAGRDHPSRSNLDDFDIRPSGL